MRTRSADRSPRVPASGRRRYCYYSCRTYCRAGKEVCAGVRVATEVLDEAVLAHLADVVCTSSRVAALGKAIQNRDLEPDDLARTWRALVTADHDVGRAYAWQLIERIVLCDEKAVIIGKQGGEASV
jgi:hypothetical protein